jgi:hypothetical protein
MTVSKGYQDLGKKPFVVCRAYTPGTYTWKNTNTYHKFL